MSFSMCEKLIANRIANAVAGTGLAAVARPTGPADELIWLNPAHGNGPGQRRADHAEAGDGQERRAEGARDLPLHHGEAGGRRCRRAPFGADLHEVGEQAGGVEDRSPSAARTAPCPPRRLRTRPRWSGRTARRRRRRPTAWGRRSTAPSSAPRASRSPASARWRRTARATATATGMARTAPGTPPARRPWATRWMGRIAVRPVLAMMRPVIIEPTAMKAVSGSRISPVFPAVVPRTTWR